MPHIIESKIMSTSASLHAGGILAGAASVRIYDYLESQTGLPMVDLFPAGLIAASVNSFAASSFALGYSAQKYAEIFDLGAEAFSPSHHLTPSLNQIKRQIQSFAAKQAIEWTPNPLQRFIPAKLRDMANNPLMNTTAFDALLHKHLNGYTLQDLKGSVVISAGLVTSDPQGISKEFSRVVHADGRIEYSPDHKEVLLLDIVKASSAIPGFIKGHHIDRLGQMFNDNGHVLDFASPVMKLHSIDDPALQPAHVILGRVNFFLPDTMTDHATYNQRAAVDHLTKGVYKGTTCAHNFNAQARIVKQLLGDDNVFDLSIYVDPKTHPSDLMPKDDMLLNSPDQRRRIDELVDFEINSKQHLYTRLVDVLGENALKVRDLKINGAFAGAQDDVRNNLGYSDDDTNHNVVSILAQKNGDPKAAIA